MGLWGGWRGGSGRGEEEDSGEAGATLGSSRGGAWIVCLWSGASPPPISVGAEPAF